MRRVGERPGVAALADVQADVPDEAEQRADERRDEQRDRHRDPRRPLEPAAGPFGDVVEPGDLAGAVQVTEPAEQRPDDHGHHGHADHLTYRGAPTLVRRGNQGNLRRTRHLPHLVRIGGNFLLVGNVARFPGVETRRIGNWAQSAHGVTGRSRRSPSTVTSRCSSKKQMWSRTGSASCSGSW